MATAYSQGVVVNGNVATGSAYASGYAFSAVAMGISPSPTTRYNVGTHNGSFSANITVPCGGYVYSRVAYSNDGSNWSYGTTNSAATNPCLYIPVVTTTTITSITLTGATGGGNVTSGGYPATVLSRGICWTTGATPTIADAHTTNGGGTGVFSSILTGLTQNTIYHVRAYARNTTGTGYGAIQTFTTLSQPQLITKAISGITEISADSGGNVYYSGTSLVSDRGICWAITQNPTIINNHISQHFSGTTGISNTYLAYWHFDETSGTTLFDSSGNAHTLTMNNATSRITGYSGECIYAPYNLNNQRISAIDNLGITTLPLTFDFYFKYNSAVVQQYTALFDWYVSGQYAGVTALHDTNANSITITYGKNSGGIVAGSRKTFLFTGATFTIGTWYHIIIDCPNFSTCSIKINNTFLNGGYLSGTGNAISFAGAVFTFFDYVNSIYNNNQCIDEFQINHFSGITGSTGGIGTFYLTLTGLSQNNTYYVRAFATNSQGTNYGNQQTFSIPITAPRLTGGTDIIGFPLIGWSGITQVTTWTGATSQRWYHKISTDPNYTLIATLGKTTGNTYIKLDLKPNISYSFYTTFYKTGTESLPSNVITINNIAPTPIAIYTTTLKV